MKERLLRYGAVLVVGILIGVLGYRCATSVDTVTKIQQDGSPQVFVNKKALDVKDVLPHVASPKVKELVQAQKAAGRAVQTVAQTTGTVRLEFRNKVEAIAVVAKDKKGQPTASLNLFQIDASGGRVALTDVETVVVNAQPQRAHWNTTFQVQAGVGLGPKAVVGLRWLQRGSSPSAEDNTWALLSPAVQIDQQKVIPSVMPFSLNVGRLTRIFRDVWVSPVVGWDGKQITYSGAVTASF